jgi:hypothetical protein
MVGWMPSTNWIIALIVYAAVGWLFVAYLGAAGLASSRPGPLMLS